MWSPDNKRMFNVAAPTPYRPAPYAPPPAPHGAPPAPPAPYGAPPAPYGAPPAPYGAPPAPYGAPPAYPAYPTAARPQHDPSGGWQHAIEGLIALMGSPIAAIGGAFTGALVARVAGKAMLSGGAIGAVVGGAALTAFYFGKDLLHWASHKFDRTPPSESLGQILATYTPAAFAVTAFPAAGFALAGPWGAMVGATIALPVGFAALLAIASRFTNASRP